MRQSKIEFIFATNVKKILNSKEMGNEFYNIQSSYWFPHRCSASFLEENLDSL